MIKFLSWIIIAHYFTAYTASEHTAADLASGKVEFLVVNKSEIWRVNQNGDKHQYVTKSALIADFDYHLKKNLLFWIDAEKHEIHSQPFDANATNPRIIFKQEGNWEPVALAIDSIGDKVYVADIVGGKIDLFELDGRRHSILCGANLVRPLDIKLDPYERYLFILDGFRIIRANMDGSLSVSIIRRNINTVHGISLDLLNKRVYWSAMHNFKMMSANYSGNEMIFSYSSNSTILTWSKFTVLNETVFWAGHFVHYKSKCSDDRPGLSKKSLYPNNPIPSIKILNFSNEDVIKYNPCNINNGGCEHMCVLTSESEKESNETYQCVCNVGWQLDINMKNCSRVEKFLMYSQGTIIKSYSINNLSMGSEPYFPIAEVKGKFTDFDYQYCNNYLYYLVKNPLEYDTIYKVHLIDNQPTAFLEGKHENYQSLSVDWLASNLYYTDALTGVINVVSTMNESRKMTVLKNLEHPEDIVVHSIKGFIFFFQTNKSTRITTLSRARIDGLNLTVFNEMPLKKRCGFALDYYDDKIYWYEWKNDYIKYSNLYFDGVQTIKSLLTKYVYTISIDYHWIYVATTVNEGVYRIDKKTGEPSDLILSDFTNRITKLKVFDSNLYKLNQNHPCILNYGNCSNICSAFPQSTDKSWVKVCFDFDKNLYTNDTVTISS